MDKLQKYVKSVLGKRVGNGQCVGLFRDCTERFLRTPVLERLGANGGAFGLFTRYDTDVGEVSRRVFERIAYQSGMLPQRGDFIIWGPTKGNQFGHVGIFLRMLPDGRMEILDQDGLIEIRGQGQSQVKITQWTFNHCLGWLRLRKRG